VIDARIAVTVKFGPQIIKKHPAHFIQAIKDFILIGLFLPNVWEK